MELEKIIEKVCFIVRMASRHLDDEFHIVKHSANPATNIDIKVGRFIESALREIIDIDVISEDIPHKQHIKKRNFWLVDPIDGTMNFIAGSPDFSISVALIDENYKSLASVVYIPRHNVTYTATLGGGAYVNGSRIVKRKPILKIVSYGLAEDAKENQAEISKSMLNLISGDYVLRQSGSASLDICRVAAGTWSGFFEKRLYAWDIVGPNLIAEESGCFSLIDETDNAEKYDYFLGTDAEILQDLIKLTR